MLNAVLLEGGREQPIVAPLLYSAANSGETITDVSHWVDRFAFDEVATILHQLGDEDANAAWQAIKELPHETRGSVLGTAMAIFRAFGSPRVRAATSCGPNHTSDDTLNIARLLRDNGRPDAVELKVESSSSADTATITCRVGRRQYQHEQRRACSDGAWRQGNESDEDAG